MPDVHIRALETADVDAAQRMSYDALRTAGKAYGWEMPEPDDQHRENGRRRFHHVLTHDPAGAVVAEREGEVVGVGLATRRARLWFLSLLTVSTTAQAAGIGRRLLAATMQTLDAGGYLCASDDPKALRRYRLAGFELAPAYGAKGSLDRSLIPAPTAVRDGDHAEHRQLVEDVAAAQRGAPHGPDLDHWQELGRRLLICDSPRGRGYVLCSDTGPLALGATTPDAAAELLWACLAETTAPQVEVDWMTGAQQWALDVALAARLSLRPTGSVCRQGAVGPMAPYLPSGGLG